MESSLVSDRERLLPLDARRVPPARARGGRVGGPLPRDDRGPPGAEPRSSRGGCGRSCRRRRRSSPEPFERGPRRPRPGGPARRHPLAAPGLARLLPDRRLGPVGARPTSSRRGSACRGCSGRRRRPAPSWRRSSSTGWPSCSACRSGSARRRRRRRDRGVGARAPRSAPCSPPAGGRPATARFDRPASPTRPRRPTARSRRRVRIAGLRPDQLRLIDVDDAFALRPDALAAAMAEDRAAGLMPFFVVANVGTTSSTALDPLAPDRRRLRRARRLAARRRRARRVGAGVPRAALDRRRRRAGRQLLHEPAQVAVHQLRLRLLLGGRPGRR